MNFAVIFDMDGVLVDNNPVHLEAWKIFCKKYNTRQLTDFNNFFGRNNRDILNALFNSLSISQIKAYSDEKEAIYRDLYRHNIAPVTGLIKLLQKLSLNGIKTAVATSASIENLNFVLDSLYIRTYFNILIDESFVKEAKPNPQIYALTANKLGISPEKCIVFEDSFSGIKAAVNAGMKVVGITTTHNANELEGTINCINNFNEITISDLEKIITN